MNNRRSSLVWVLAIAVWASMRFGAGSLIARAVTLQAPAESAHVADRFSGTWHWMFNGKSFATLILARSESGYTGSLTGSEIELNDDGSLKTAAPSRDASPSPIEKAWLDGSDLHVVVMDGNDPMEWVVTVKDDTHGEVRPISGDTASMKPIPLEKAR